MSYNSKMLSNLLTLVAALLCLSAHAADIQDEVERDFALRSIGDLEISNTRGGIVIHGWSMDKIRVKARRTMKTENAEEAKKLAAAVDFRYRELDGNIELSAEYGKGLDIQDRLKERANPKASMEMVVYAPANLKLRVWAVNGAVHVKEWRAPLEARTDSGPIQIEDVRAETVSLLCPSCEMSVKNVHSSVRCMGGSGPINLNAVNGKSIYVESNSGQQQLKRVSGEQLYVSKDGGISGSLLQGRVEFHTLSGEVSLTDGAGFLSGSTDSGNIDVKMLQWKFADKALIESVKGSIFLTLPSSFAGEVDLWSLYGHTHTGFTVAAISDNPVFGPEPANHLQGRVGQGGDQLRVNSQFGDINISKGI